MIFKKNSLVTVAYGKKSDTFVVGKMLLLSNLEGREGRPTYAPHFRGDRLGQKDDDGRDPSHGAVFL